MSLFRIALSFLIALIIYSNAAACDAPPQEKKTVCLNMIVKNESKVIERCLASVLPLIDTWIIVDTGSNDGTQDIIRAFLKDIPGQLYERPWVDFGHNRQEALLLAKGKADYLLFMDADEKLFFSTPLDKKMLDKDIYYVTVKGSTHVSLAYQRFFLVNNRLEWTWKDILHEYLEIPPTATTAEELTTVTCITDSDGFRSQDPNKYLKDAEILKKALEKDPNNSRYLFYLAQSYHNAKQFELALETYEKRATFKGLWEQEVFWSLYSAAKIRQILGKPADEVIQGYCKAYQSDTTRAEPLYWLASYLHDTNNTVLSYAVAKLGLSLPIPPQGKMYVEQWIYDFGLLAICASNAIQLKNYQEARDIYQQILSLPHLQEETRNDAKRRLVLTQLVP